MIFQSCANLFLLDLVVSIVWLSKIYSSGADVNGMRDRYDPQRAVIVPMRNNEKGIQSL